MLSMVVEDLFNLFWLSMQVFFLWDCCYVLFFRHRSINSM